MHLLSKVAQVVTVASRLFEFRQGESIHTENSCKYSIQEFLALTENEGLYRKECGPIATSFSVFTVFAVVVNS
jgi:uncharacterized SAM-dependent methyltransferase